MMAGCPNSRLIEGRHEAALFLFLTYVTLQQGDPQTLMSSTKLIFDRLKDHLN